jgi:NADP-dependent 3-hydroxy acid dehydrogenase YdfG
VAIVGRREDALAETRALAGADARMVSFPCDIGDADAAAAMGLRVLTEFGEVEALVNAAGTNTPRRSLEVLSADDYHAIMNANLNGGYYCVQAFLPAMRARGSGTIVNVISDAGKVGSAKAGPAYVMSKFGLAGLTQSINAEERGHGVRAIGLFPGDIDTALLKKRPTPPDAEVLAKMMRAEDVARCIMFCIGLPRNVVVEEMLVRPL